MITTDLVVRSEPGTGAESEIYPGTLSAPTTVYVIDGPVAANGYDWYLVDPVRVDWAIWGGPPAGWVAAAGKDGERWLAPTPEEYACDPAPTLSELAMLAPQYRLHCWPGVELHLQGAAEECTLVADVPWDGFCRVLPVGSSDPPPGCMDCAAPSLRVAFSTADAAVPPDGSTITFSGQFDDPSAATCIGVVLGYEGPPQLLTYECRQRFVATAITVVAP